MAVVKKPSKIDQDEVDQPKEEKVSIFFEWINCATDPTSYKQLSPTFHPLNVKIQVDVPKKYVLAYNQEDGTALLTPQGAAYAMRKIAISIINIQQSEE